MRTSVSLLHAYNQIAKMDHSLITSFNELAMGFVRGGPRMGWTISARPSRSLAGNSSSCRRPKRAATPSTLASS
jgi:hypothetical protein